MEGQAARSGGGPAVRTRIDQTGITPVVAHASIGEGCLGLDPFRRLLHDARFAALPILIETEKSARSENAGTVVADPFDVKNLATLRRLREAGSKTTKTG